MARRSKKPTLKELQQKVRNDLKRWDRVKKYGAGDPLHTDGTNLHLIRNHIAFARGQLQAHCKTEGIEKCPKESRIKLPNPVGWGFCAPKSKSGPCKERRKRTASKKRKRRTGSKKKRKTAR